MALLDEGETDWKVIVIDVNDPLAPKLNGKYIFIIIIIKKKGKFLKSYY